MTELGTLGGVWSEPVAINERGQVVGNSWTARGTHAFFWESGKMRDLGTLGGARSFATAINNRGQVVGLSDSKTKEVHVFLWENGRMRDLDRGMSDVVDINDQGQIIGAVETVRYVRSIPYSSKQAVVWQDGRLTFLTKAESLPQAINERGDVALTLRSEYPFLWAKGQMSPISHYSRSFLSVVGMNERGQVLLEAWESSRVWHRGAFTRLEDRTGIGFTGGVEPRAINDLGVVAGTDLSRAHEARACLWKDGRIRELGTLGGKTSRAFAINNMNQIVGRSATTRDRALTHAFVWQDGRMTDLGSVGGLSTEAIAITHNGRILGSIVTQPATAQHSRKARAVVWTPGRP